MGFLSIRLPKFSLEKVIASERNLVFEVFSNYGDYQNLIPQHFPSIRILSVRGNVAIVEEHMNLGPDELILMAKHVSNKPLLHEVYVIGGDLKGSHFRHKFVEVPEGTWVTADVEIKLGKLKIKRLFATNRYAKYYEEILNNFAKLCKG